MSSPPRNLFPLGLATGPAFCNRRRERQRLAANILGAQHTWLTARRRFGKSSLVSQVLLDLATRRRPRVDSAYVDLLVVSNVASLEDSLRQAVAELTARIVPQNRRVLATLEGVFRAFRPELAITSKGMEVRLKSDDPSVASVQNLLSGLDELAAIYKRRAVLVLDEFQQLARIRSSAATEGAIRHVAQRASALSFVFLGSERSLLAQMFEDESRPLFRLCERIELDRIEAADYGAFLQDAAKWRWKSRLSETAVNKVLELSQRHPYYLNALCRRLFMKTRRPGSATVVKEWAGLVDQERHRATQIVVDMSANQRALLAQLARTPTDQPSAHTFLATVGLPSASLLQALAALERRDLVHADADGVYRLVDPVMASYLSSL